MQQLEQMFNNLRLVLAFLHIVILLYLECKELIARLEFSSWQRQDIFSILVIFTLGNIHIFSFSYRSFGNLWG